MLTNIQLVHEDHRRGASHSYCSNDMRSAFPGCHQYGDMWCWATAVAAATEYYTGRSGDQCIGLECQIVGQKLKDNCCPYESASDTCLNEGAYVEEIVDSLKHFTGKKFTHAKGTVHKSTLEASLESGSPVILLIGDDEAPSHAVTLHGCNGSGKYWYHNPERDFGTFKAVDYDWLAGDMCFAWVKSDSPTGEALEVCSGSKNPGEYFRFTHKWWDTLYIPGETVV